MTQERILIIDSQIPSGHMLRTRLEARGYLVTYAKISSTAMTALETSWVDLIVLAAPFGEPDESKDLFQKIKKRKDFEHIPVVMYAATAMEAKRCSQLGATAVFTQPYTMTVFLDEIKDILTKKILLIGTGDDIHTIIIKGLSRYAVEIDSVKQVTPFYKKIDTHRYLLVVMPHELRSTSADTLIAAVKQSEKNSHIPIMVYFDEACGMLSLRQQRKVAKVKEACLGASPGLFMEKSFSRQRFLRFLRQYLEPQL